MLAHKFDFETARQGFTDSGFYIGTGFGDKFSKYSPAYTVTNENLRTVINATDTKDARVLVNTGSGDTAMFYSIAGAKDIDTFDLSYCAKVIMDLKTAAIHVLSHNEYLNMLDKLHNANGLKSIPHISKIYPLLFDGPRKFLHGMDGCKIFSNGLTPSSYSEYMPTFHEYFAMQETIDKPFKFIWSDICNLHKDLNNEYDIMNFSNIFQYINDAETITEIINNLKPHLSPSGTMILHTTWFFRNFEYKNYAVVQEAIKSWAKLGLLKSKGQESIILKRNK